ncbi:MAG: GNAT family N-acetyltransferase [Nitrospiria bacterium]
MEYGGLRGFVDDLFVRPAEREKGLGAAVLKTVKQHCRDRGASGRCWSRPAPKTILRGASIRGPDSKRMDDCFSHRPSRVNRWTAMVFLLLASVRTELSRALPLRGLRRCARFASNMSGRPMMTGTSRPSMSISTPFFLISKN